MWSFDPVMVVVFVVLTAYIAWQAHCFQNERAQREEAFKEERLIWIRERRDLLNRIQVPEAAPFMEPEEGQSPDDLPTLPEFTLDEAELEKAKEHLASVGYESGPGL